MTNPSGCFESNCFTVEEGWPRPGTVVIRGAEMQWIGIAVDTAEAWRIFRDEIKAGKYDHIGQAQAVPS